MLSLRSIRSFAKLEEFQSRRDYRSVSQTSELPQIFDVLKCVTNKAYEIIKAYSLVNVIDMPHAKISWLTSLNKN